MIEISPAKSSELTAIMAIENQGFSPAEAASPAAMQERIEKIPDTFLVAHEDDQVLGYIVGPAYHERYIDDALFDQVVPNKPEDGTQTILSLATAPFAQKRGFASQLLEALEYQAKKDKRQLISLTCLERLIPFYQAHGYQNEGVAASTHGGETWYNMTLDLTK
ncbi:MULTISPECIES: GNAT family N-acetyltransferase [unclassified Lactococcus]|uniref:GNAT family N-acetyltransferase n=1 Tax=unclassified Lactococcus TaxID=2643510 RepID=UPI0011CB298C|nr:MULTISPECIES: GNAT family N-acetyltransferase [unclassified Lactococcus]MQW22339.1 GNAT family N-acetyltransferase [Lactococcus sp. dk101]TXK45261.1 GNAT family N-acetyltransferase [Lactococcus sp. dk310]TXK50960.1 GNAT family N-acetyltransferase [Lactococcus sp. dk322]